MNFSRISVLLVVLVLAAGCSSWGWGNKSDEYKGAAARTEKPLEVPPELTAPTMDDRYSVPDPRTVTSFSTYNQKGAQAPAAAAPAAPLLPKFDDVRMERAGPQRWLVVKGDPEKVWPVVREFWIDSGFQLSREAPELGLIETDWHEDRSKIPDDWFRRTMGKFIDGMYSNPRRDKYRTRLEKGVEPGTTEVFVSNRNVTESFTSSYQDYTTWRPGPADADLEAEMLSRLMVKIGGGDTKVTTASAAQPGRRGVTPTPPAEPRNAVLENNGAGPLVVNDSFDRAWRRVGLALDRVGFTVEDRDRSKGIFYVRYIDPEVDASASSEKKSWTEKLMFWKAPNKNTQPQYRIHVADAGANSSQVLVQDSKGTTETSATGKKILGLLYDQLK